MTERGVSMKGRDGKRKKSRMSRKDTKRYIIIGREEIGSLSLRYACLKLSCALNSAQCSSGATTKALPISALAPTLTGCRRP